MRALVAVVIAVGCGSKAPPVVAPPPAPAPVIETPKLRLPRVLVPESYAARLVIDPDKPTFTGHLEITGMVPVATKALWLHGRKLAIAKATVNGTALKVTPRGEDLLLLEGELAAGRTTIAIDYTGLVDATNTSGMFVEKTDDVPYVFSHFEATYARRVFPCIDEPDVKVPWQLTLDVPKGLVAVSNQAPVKEEDLGERHVVEFAPTKPLPSYLVAFGVGPFEVVPAGTSASGIPVRIIVTKGHAAEAAYAAKSTPKLIDILETWFAIPFPYAKLDVLAIPATAGFGAMENAGLITISATDSYVDATSSQLHRLGYVETMAHELAHQWVGDLVTMSWWDDLWLNEGFATFMQGPIVIGFDQATGNKLKYDLVPERYRNSALTSDSLLTARQIRQEIVQPGDIVNAFDDITYSKGGAVLDMFQHFIGPSTFREGTTNYLKSRAYANATAMDFITALGKAAGRDLAPAFATFLDQPGAPELKMRIDCDGAKAKLELSQRRFVPAGSIAQGGSKVWQVPVCVAYDDHGKRAEACTLLTGSTGELALTGCPRWVMPNADAHGYYRVDYTPAQMATLRDEAWPLLTGAERHALFHDVAASAMAASRAGTTKLPLAGALSFAPKLMEGTDRFALSDLWSVIGRVEPWIPTSQRPRYESWLRSLFVSRAARLGFVTKPSDDLDAESSRSTVLSGAALGHDPATIKQYVAASAHWRDVPQTRRRQVLVVTADNQAGFATKLIAEIPAEKNPTLRNEMILSLVSTRQPKVIEEALPLLLDPKVDIHESTVLLYARANEPVRAEVEKFYLAHQDELAKRFGEDVESGAIYAEVGLFTAACDPRRRDEIVAAIAPFAKKPGAERVVAQATEGLDQCIATRTVLEPEIREWLDSVKLGK